MYNFFALKSGEDWSPRIAFYGDLGSVNAKSISYLQEDAQNGIYDAVLHVGKYIFCCLFYMYLQPRVLHRYWLP